VSVLHVITDANRRGAQVFAVALAEEHRRLGRAADVIALGPATDGRGLSVPVVADGASTLSELLALRDVARGARVVVGHGSRTLPACAVALAGTRCRFVYRNIGDPNYWWSTPLRRVRTRVTLTQADHVVALWPGAARIIAGSFGVRPRRISVIANGVAPAGFTPADEIGRVRARRRLGIDGGEPVALYVGSLSREKSVNTAIEAVAALTGWRLMIVGDGPLQDQLKDFAAERAPHRVSFLGSTANVADVYGAADVVVLPSLTEGMPGVLIEAGMSGLPTVATAVGAVSEIIEHGETGFLVPPRRPDRFAEALIDAYADRDRLGKAARDRCLDRFDITRIAGHWDRVLEGLGAWHR